MSTYFTRIKHSLLAIAATSALLLGGTHLATAAEREQKDIRIVFVTHGNDNSVYWSVVKNGAIAAGKQMGVTVEYQAPQTFDVVAMSRMLEAATASHPDGLVVSIPDTTALKEPIMAAKAAGIPIVVIDTGLEQVPEWGLDLYVGGGSEYDNGLNAGKLMGKDGVKHAICVNHEVGNVSLDNRCKGFDDGLKESGGKSEVVVITTDPTESTRRVDAYLTAHPETDALLTLGPDGGAPILKMLEERGDLAKYKFGNFDLSPEILQAIADGKMMFAIDSQQYLQGYYPVVFLVGKVMNRTFPTSAVWTGPAFVTQKDAAAVIQLSKAGIR